MPQNQNPVRLIRERNGYTQAEVANLAGITPQSVLRYEQGVYDNLSPNLSELLVSLIISDPSPEFWRLRLGTDPTEFLTSDRSTLAEALSNGYTAYRRATQRQAAYLFDGAHPGLIGSGIHHHPFIEFRTRVLKSGSRMLFCKTLAINPAVVAEYEKGRRAAMPPMITLALFNAGVSATLLTALKEAGSRYATSVKLHD